MREKHIESCICEAPDGEHPLCLGSGDAVCLKKAWKVTTAFQWPRVACVSFLIMAPCCCIMDSQCGRAFPGVRLAALPGQPWPVHIKSWVCRWGTFRCSHCPRCAAEQGSCIVCAVSTALLPSTIYIQQRIIKEKLNWNPLSMFTLCSKYFYHIVLCAGSAVNFSIAAGSFVITLLIMNCCLLAVAAHMIMIPAGGRVIEGRKGEKCADQGDLKTINVLQQSGVGCKIN